MILKKLRPPDYSAWNFDRDITWFRSFNPYHKASTHYSDPDELPGLAHFLEHMVFMGSEKFPNENSFAKFIQDNGGSYNAWTGSEHTIFFFEVQRHSFSMALDMFSQFFIDPLMVN